MGYCAHLLGRITRKVQEEIQKEKDKKSIKHVRKWDSSLNFYFSLSTFQESSSIFLPPKKVYLLFLSSPPIDELFNKVGIINESSNLKTLDLNLQICLFLMTVEYKIELLFTISLSYINGNKLSASLYRFHRIVSHLDPLLSLLFSSLFLQLYKATNEQPSSLKIQSNK